MKITKLIFLSLGLCLLSGGISAKEWHPSKWPVLKHYDSKHLFRIALPIGGIGTGTVSLGGRGELKDWQIMNVPGKDFSTINKGNNAPFFAIYIKPEHEKATSKLLAGPLYDQEYEDCEGMPVNHHGFPRFSQASFDAAYPFGEVHLSDSQTSVKVTIQGFNPLIPADADRSGLPVAVLAYKVDNTSDKPMEVAICGSIRNFIGKDGSKGATNWKGTFVPSGAVNNKNIYKEENGIKGLYFYSEGVDRNDPAWGTIALTTMAEQNITYSVSSRPNEWENSTLRFWDDFSTDGQLSNRPLRKGDDQDPMGSLAVKKTIPAHSSRTFTFYLTWNFPNRKAWASKIVGNYYSTRFQDAWDAAQKILPQIPGLEKSTLTFVNAFLESTYPDVVKEAALFNLSVLRSQTVFQLPDGHLMGWEGVMDKVGSCYGSCTHVWNYEQATPFLFGKLAKTMRDVEFNYATKPNGLMNFRAALPLSEAAKPNMAAADGQMGCIMKMYRDWQLSGDNEFLKSYWPQVKKVLSYAWLAKSWDGNQDGVMEGAQANTMDVVYYGPNPQMGFWYLGALKAAEKMALAEKDKTFAKKCHSLFMKGSKWMDANLFNGEYYEQKITDPHTFEYLDMNDPKTPIPPYQLGRGCLVDQLVGQYMAQICGLGYLGDKNHIQTTLHSIMKYNYLSDFSNHFNNMRSFILGHEAGLLMASWPHGRLKIPFPYFSESMTGFEYCAATGMLYEGMTDDGLKCIESIRDRFDGSKRNPFSEPECGYHYARSMASWATVLALSDFRYSGVEHSIHFTDTPGKYFWSNGYAWGLCTVGVNDAEIEVLKGSITLDKFQLGNKKEIKLKDVTISSGESKRFKYD